MQNYCKTIGAIAAVSTLVAGNAMAEVEYELHTGYSSEYLFRGLNYGQDLVEVGADVKGEVYGLGLSAGAWYGNIQNAHVVGQNPTGFDELDLYAAVSKDFGWATTAIGYINRNYSIDPVEPWNSPFDTEQEVYFSVSRQFYGVDTSLTYYWGVEGDNDGYSELKANKAWELSPCLTLNTGGNVGYLVEQGQFTALTLKVSLDWGFAGTAKLSPFIAGSWSLSDDNDTAYWGNKNQFLGGVMLSVGF
ncbi:MAG: hypothetical protein K9N23_19760 [Akkermansiaceae bacterium]|nr:hypothetical protein [Akkermansiaceae bacterium]MCF7733934.1 hypothetical protein [Akkermansiaceae bacterium]